MMYLSQISEAVNGQMSGTNVELHGVSINTRTDCEGRLFVALKGDRFDAHEFIEQAVQAGAGAALLEREVAVELPTVMVNDTHQALADLAAWWRSQFVIPVVGVTGSVGKTSVKEMLGAIFAEIGQGVVTKGNLNNEIGVPLTLMRLTQQDQYAIIEMGMNHAGEIFRLSNIARPTIALVNNAAAAHLEGLGSIEAVAQAKGEIFSGLAVDGVAIINNDDPFSSDWAALASGHRIVTFGLDTDADITAQYHQQNETLLLTVNAGGQIFEARLPTVGEHNVRNALAAIATSFAANIPADKIKAGLEAYRPVSGRLNLIKLDSATLIDDTYNANPSSMEAAMKVLATYPQNTLILGDMAELGEAAESEHRRLGEIASRLGIQSLLVCGAYADTVASAYGKEAQAFSAQEELIEYAVTHISGGTVLVKGSRSAQMEKVVAALESALSGVPAQTNRSSGEH